MLGDVLKTYNNDERGASEALKGISKQLETEQDKKIKELQEMFPKLRKKTIQKTLQANQWDVEAAVLPLFNELEKIKEAERRKQVIFFLRFDESGSFYSYAFFFFSLSLSYFSPTGRGSSCETIKGRG
jgi:hypothetical protein